MHALWYTEVRYVTLSQNLQAAVGEEVEEARDLLQEKEEKVNKKEEGGEME